MEDVLFVVVLEVGAAVVVMGAVVPVVVGAAGVEEPVGSLLLLLLLSSSSAPTSDGEKRGCVRVRSDRGISRKLFPSAALPEEGLAAAVLVSGDVVVPLWVLFVCSPVFATPSSCCPDCTESSAVGPIGGEKRKRDGFWLLLLRCSGESL